MVEIIHRDEGRHLFGLNPEGYDDARPDYPAWIFKRLCDAGALGPGIATLEVGPGTGRATRHLLAHGANPLILIEPDRRFAASLQASTSQFNASCRTVHQSFEGAELADGQFDLVACATAFHWIDALPGLRKIKRVLKPHGTVALFWNVLQDLNNPDPFHDATTHLLAPLAYGPAGAPNRVPYALDQHARQADAHAAGFANVAYVESRWTYRLDTDHVGRLYESFSQIQRLSELERKTVLSKLMEIADTAFAGQVERNVTTCLYLISR